jgi:flagellar motor switch protein FliM
MSTPEAIASDAAQVRRYELGRPIIRREQRIAFERIHRSLAQTWSDSMTEYLPAGAVMEFEGLDFDAFATVAIDASASARIELFSIASTPVNGFLMMSGALAKFLVRSRLGLKAAAGEKTDAPFTRIETAIARELTRSMLARLEEAYAGAALGSIGNIRECEDLADSFLFEPEESLALLKFHLSAGGQELPVLLALSGSIVAAMTEHQPAAVAEPNGRNAVADVVRRLPINVEVVLGSWKAPLRELMQLRAGDRIVLPDGEDAWLAARGVRLRRASVELTASGATVEIRQSARLR